MDIVELNRVIEKKGMDWLVAAMIEGSIGYHSPKHAKILIERAVAGEVKDYCERCVACFNCDLMKMIERDVEIFERLEARDPHRSERIVSVAKQIILLSYITTLPDILRFKCQSIKKSLKGFAVLPKFIKIQFSSILWKTTLYISKF